MYANSFKKLNPDELPPWALGYHEWSKDQYYQNIKAQLEKAGQEGRGAINDIRFYLPQWASDPRLLWRVWRWLAINGGQASTGEGIAISMTTKYGVYWLRYRLE